LELVLLENPILLVFFGIAIVLCAVDIVHKAGYAFRIASGVVFVASLVYAILLGASLEEILLVTLVMFALNLTAFVTGGGRDK